MKNWREFCMSIIVPEVGVLQIQLDSGLGDTHSLHRMVRLAKSQN